MHRNNKSSLFYTCHEKAKIYFALIIALYNSSKKRDVSKLVACNDQFENNLFFCEKQLIIYLEDKKV
jgi:hypothetical protein